MAHYDIFREQLAIRFPGYGHALWEPSPGGLYHVGGVGDVGYVSQGRFHRLFNILLPANDPSHANFGVPDGHEPFTPNVSNHIISGILCPEHFCSAGVTLETDEYHGQFATRPRDPGEVSFSCRGKQGAILSLPIQATRENTVMSKEFGKWMIQHIALWFAWARDKGLEIDRMEDIVLVTGTDRTSSWANVAFLGGQADARVSFGVEVANSRINWQFSPERKTGAVWNWRPNGENLPEDQCIFIRGFRVRRRRLILRSRLRAAAGPNPDPKDSDGEPDSDVELISIPAVPKYHDPLHVILEYIAEERPHCDTVIVHDDDLALLDVLGDGTSLEGLEPDVVMRCLRSSKPVLHEVVLGKNLSSSNNCASDDTEVVRVASLSATFEGQLPRISDLESTSDHIIITNSPQPHVGKLEDNFHEMKDDSDEIQANVGKTKWIQIEDVRKWFSPPDPSVNYNIALKVYQKGTAAWFFEGSKFKRWESSGHLLWIYGKPGSGKTVLCSAIIKHVLSLRDAGQASVAYFYFDSREKEKQNVPNVVTSLLTQFAASSESCCNTLSHLYSTHGNGAYQPSLRVLTDCLREILLAAAQQPIYIIVDALDECPDMSGMPNLRSALLDLLKELVDWQVPNLHICVTSRPGVRINNVVQQAYGDFLRLDSENGQEKDISDYIASVVHSDGEMKKWQDSEKELVVKTLSKKADGNFRLVFYQLEVLRRCLPTGIRQALDQLPRTLDETYARILSQIPEASQTHVRHMLQSLTVAVRPLRVEELAEVLAFNFDTTQGSIPRYCPDWRPNDQEHAVLSTCSSLITIFDAHDGSHVVKFSHLSVKKFLMANSLTSSPRELSQSQIPLGAAHTTLAQICLASLLYLDDRMDEETIKALPLAKYAAEHWVTHAQFEGVASRVKDGMESLFDSDKPHFAAWIRIYNIDQPSQTVPSEIPTPLYFSSLCGFPELAEHLAIKHPQHVNAMGGRHKFPLLAALVGKHDRVTEILIKWRANVDVRGFRGRMPLHEAITSISMVQLLLKSGADINCQNDDFRTPLHLAFYYGKLEVARVLLEHNADVDSPDNGGTTPLHLLFGNRYSNKDDILDLARLLLRRGADVNRREKDNNTPLHLAMDSSMYKPARTLLEHGADVTVGNNKGKTPLHLLFGNRYADKDEILDLTQLLWRRGADVNRRDKDNDTPLHLAIDAGMRKSAKILLEHGADATAENNKGKTPLHLLVGDRYADKDEVLDLTQSLLKRGAGVNRREKDNNTPLHLAMDTRMYKPAKILLEHGADVTVENNTGKTPFHLLVGDRYADKDEVLDLTQSLLKRGAGVNRWDKDNNTPLHLAIDARMHKPAKILLEHGADATVENNEGKTPLDLLFGNRYADKDEVLDLTQSLLKRGAGVNRREKDNNTPLHLAIDAGMRKSARILLEHGADATVENNKGKTPLHLLFGNRYADKDYSEVLDLTQLLLKHGADVNRRDKDNNTPLHQAIDTGMYKSARILLEHGADATVENNVGDAPLHLLIKKRYSSEEALLDIVQLLLESGADVNAREKNQSTPLHVAAANGRLDLTRWLLEHGAHVNAKNNQGETPLQLARGRGKIDIEKVLLACGADAHP